MEDFTWLRQLRQWFNKERHLNVHSGLRERT